MKEYAVLSILGSDRVGVADDVATTLTQHDLKIEQSRMTVLGGQFAILVQLSGDRDVVSSVRRDLAELGQCLGFHLQMAPFVAAARREPKPRVRHPAAGEELLIESFSSEPCGLNAITGILKRRLVNIEELETEVDSAPCTSRMTFHTTARVKVPASCSLKKLKKELHDLERNRDLDIVIKPRSAVLVE